MRITILTILLIFLSSCWAPSPKISVNIDEAYGCEYAVIVEQAYAPDKLITYHVNFIGNNAGRAIALLNDVYAPGNIQFVLSTTSTLKRPRYESPYDYRDLLRKNYKSGYITIINIEGIDVPIIQKRVLGAAYGVPDIDPNGRLILHDARPVCFVRKIDNILIHEIGHVLGLKHLFQGEDVLNKGLNCDTGDNISTTVYIPGMQVYVDDCEPALSESALAKYTDQEIEDYIGNYESYSPEACMYKFEPEQFQRQRKMAEINPRLQDAERLNL